MSAKTKKPRSKKAKSEPVEIPVIRIVNPFDPREHVRETLLWEPTKPLAAYFPLVEANPMVISINGKIVDHANLSVTYLSKDDNLVLCPVPTGGKGGSGKKILSIVAMIAISVVTAGWGAAAAGAMGLTGTAATIVGGVIQAGIMFAGSMLVHSVFAPSAQSNPSANAAKEPTAYGIDGAKNTSIEGVPVPVCYGKFRMAGNILGLYVENDGDTQMLYMLLAAGEGPVASIENIEINDNPIADYKDVEVQTRLGQPNQTPIEWFNDTIVAHSVGQKLTTNYTNYTTSTSVDKLRIDFAAPSGLYTIDTKTGSTGTATVPLEMQYRKQGTTDWQNVVSLNEIVEWNEIPDPDFPDEQFKPNKRVPTYQQTTALTGSRRAAVRKSFGTEKLENAVYEVRVRRINPQATLDNVQDEVYITDVNEIQLVPLTYPNTALVALKIKLGDQINSLPNVTYINGGRVINVYRQGEDGVASWSPEASTNPAWIVWDMLTHKRYGGGMSTARLDVQAFKEFSDNCIAQELEWNGVIDQESNVWDASQMVLRVGHAQLVPVGTRWTVVTEKPDTPVMMFSVANMIEGTYKETWLGTADRANEIDVTYFDKTDKNKQRTIKVYDPAVIASGQPQRTSAITLFGVDNHETALKEGFFQLNLNRYILKTVQFSAPMEAIACTVGNLILVQNDMTDWAQAGRFEAGSLPGYVLLDRKVTLEAGKQYKLLVQSDAMQRFAGTITSINGQALRLSNFDEAQAVNRIQIGGRDLRVAGTFANGVMVDDASGISLNDAYTLWQTDVIEERDVVVVAGDTDQLTLQSPLPAAPQQFDNWMFGETTKVKQRFRIKSISGSTDYKRDIVAIEYKPEVYGYERFGDQLPTIDPHDAPLSPVRDLQLYEETYVNGENIQTKIVSSWRAPAVGFYGGADIYVSKNDGPLEKIVEVKNRTIYEVTDAGRGDKLVIKVVAFDIFGKRSSFESAPSASYTVLAEIPNLDVGNVTGADFYWSGRECKIDWRYNSVTHSYEFGSEPDEIGADGGALDPHFKDYEIKVYDGTGTSLRRTDYTTDSNYTYTYDKNYADGLTRHLVFEIRMRDKFNNLGEAVTLEAMNPAPQVTSYQTSTSFETATIQYNHSADPDFAGANVFLSQNENEVKGPIELVSAAHLVYNGPDTGIVLTDLMPAADYYMRIAPYDDFGFTEVNATDVIHFKTTYLNIDAIAEGVIGDSKLLPLLKDRIDLIDAPATVVGSVAARLLAEANTRGTAITNLTNIVNTADQGLAQSISTVSAKTDSNLAAIQTETTARTNADSALATTTAALAVRVGNNESAIFNESTTRANAISAEATQRNEQLASYDTTIRSYVQNYTYSRASQDSTYNSVINLLRSEYQNADATVASQSYTKTQTDSAIATQVNQVSARLNNQGGVTLEQRFSAMASTDAGLLGQYTLRIDFNGRVAGFGLANGTGGSEFGVSADKFYVAMPGYPGDYPFTIGVVNGSPRTIIKDALIGDATINNAKIADLAVNRLKISGNSVTVPKFTNGGFAAVTEWPTVTVINSMAFYIPEQCDVLIMGAVGWSHMQFDVNTVRQQTELRVDGYTINAHGGNAYQESVALCGGVTLGAGWHNVEIYGGGNSGAVIDQTTIYILGAMR